MQLIYVFIFILYKIDSLTKTDKKGFEGKEKIIEEVSFYIHTYIHTHIYIYVIHEKNHKGLSVIFIFRYNNA